MTKKPDTKLQSQFKELALSPEDKAFLDNTSAQFRAAHEQLKRAIKGQDELLEMLVLTLAAGGHALLTGVPGTGKSVIASSIGQVFGLTTKRIQGTPDLMPSDILGVEILEENKDTGERSFRFVQGPVFSNLVMDDEINRSSPRTQAATLQAMQEKHVSISGIDYAMPEPHHHIATQNPIEQEGTNPLPEAQKDRFLIEFILDYPDRESEGEVMLATTMSQYSLSQLREIQKDKSLAIKPPVNLLVNPNDLKTVMEARDLIIAQHTVRNIPLGQEVYDAILDVVRNSRPSFKKEIDGKTKSQMTDIFNFVNDNVNCGPGTRTLQSFALLVKARALMQGRYRPHIGDVKALAEPVMRHRIDLSFTAEAEKIDQAQVIEKVTSVLQTVPGNQPR